jgi:hypothetical protein
LKPWAKQAIVITLLILEVRKIENSVVIIHLNPAAEARVCFTQSAAGKHPAESSEL